MSRAEYHMLSVGGAAMVGMTSYAQPLRAIGQALEVLNIQDFEMDLERENYFVRGWMSNNALESSNNAEQLEAVWGGWQTGGEIDANDERRAALSRIELCYTALDVERLEKEGRLRRGHADEIAGASSLSQVLRSIGGYLDQKRARLCKITRQFECMTIEYETSLGSTMKESLPLKDLYDLWVRMYLQRSTRVSRQ